MKLTHFDADGQAAMVDVSDKNSSKRTAIAHAFVVMSAEVMAALPNNKKGDPLQVARIAGIMAAKKTSELIPLCHQLPLSHVSVDFALEAQGIRITTVAATTAQTGVEMEALTAATVAALTLYDMTKALDKAIEIREIFLIEKTGGKSGGFRRAESRPSASPSSPSAIPQSPAPASTPQALYFMTAALPWAGPLPANPSSPTKSRSSPPRWSTGPILKPPTSSSPPAEPASLRATSLLMPPALFSTAKFPV